MPTFKAVQRLHRIKKDGTAEIQIRVTHERKVTYVRTGHYIKPKCLKDGYVVNHSDATLLNLRIDEKISEIRQNIIRQELLHQDINISKVTGKQPHTTETMFGAVKHVMKKFEAQNQPASFNRMQTNLGYLMEAWETDKYLTDITKIDVELYANYRFKKGNTASTVKKNLSDLATVLNHVDFQGYNHFKGYAKSIKAKPVKRQKLTADEIKLIEEISLTGLSDVVRDIFLFAFYCHGSRFESCALFEKAWIKADRISFTQNKGQKEIVIRIHPKLERIIKKYEKVQGKYLFPLIQKENIDIWEKKDIVGAKNALINTYLKRIAILCGIDKNISFHVSRHTAATIAYHSGVRSDTIKEILGHTNLKTTEGYLKSLSKERINDEFNVIYKEST